MNLQINTPNSRPIPKSHAIYTIAVIGFIFTLHQVIPVYSNSSFLSQFTTEQTVGYIYMLISALTILGFLLVPSAIRKLGNYAVTLWFVLIQILLFWGLLASSSPILIVAFFILESTIVSLISLNLDIFLEVYTDSNDVGSVRGLYNATLNASWMIAPLIGIMLINGNNNYRDTYIAGLAMLVPLFYLIYRNFPRFKDPKYTHLSPLQLVRHIAKNKNWDKLFIINIVLQTFYAWMVIYSPIYLNKTLGFSWSDIGIILVIMLLPFPLIQYPLGKFADRVHGEKAMMFIGFSLMGLATICLSFIHNSNIAIWAMMLFLTRVGAAAAEIMIETYFFKTVSPRDAAALGVFRITRPLSYFTGPLITLVGLLFVTNQSSLFIIVGAIVLLALIPISMIKDAK